MIIIGHKNIPHNKLYQCISIDAISQTPSNSILLLKGNVDEIHLLVKHCNEHSLSFCIEVEDIKELMIFAALNCTYLLIRDIKFAKQAQSLAQYYLFDSKILFVCNDEDDIELIAKEGIDGILFEPLGIS